ncbi:hypothetical protein TrCOL_g7860 [Triparma columacea]|uniref:EF-hand domain-containing protein n=1 Tax=Triparma columacea TaxID=722753 RepID=A0A9W7G9L4_9STRA|nr:hypothetical protein TrCOL_g7860 [Triparma columacea]
MILAHQITHPTAGPKLGVSEPSVELPNGKMAELPGNVNFIKGEGGGGQTGGGDIESRKMKEESGERRRVTRAHTSAVQAKDEMSTEELEGSRRQIFIIALVGTLLYIALGVAVFVFIEKWRFIDALYFIVVTLTTVGYGDQDAYGSRSIMLFQAIYALVGIMLVGSSLGIVAAEVVETSNEARQEAQKKLLDKANEMGNVMSSQRSIPKLEVEEKGKQILLGVKRQLKATLPSSFYALAPSCLKLFFLIFVGMILIYLDKQSHEEKIDFIECFYFAVITGTTIGYGDYSPNLSEGGKLAGTIYVLIAVVGLGGVLGDIAGYFIEAKQKEALERILKKKITMEDFEEFDMDGDGKIEKSEFVLRKLMLMGILHNEDVIRVEKEFDVMDVDGSGEIDMDDLRAWMEQEASRKAEEDV